MESIKDEEMTQGENNTAVSAEEISENAPQGTEIQEEYAAQKESEEIGGIDYGKLMQEDLDALRELFPHLKGKSSVLELDNPLRYAELRDLGLSPKEAYLASSDIKRAYDNRSHIMPSAPKGAAVSGEAMSQGELEAARGIFSDLSDKEIVNLYKKVLK